MTEEEKIIQKIQQLLALTESSNEHESALAAAKAVELMQKYNISEEQTRTQGPRDIIEETTTLGYKTPQPWALQLAGAIAQAYFCRILMHGGEFIFIGRPENVKAATFSYMNLSWKLINLAQIRTREYTENFKAQRGYSPRGADRYHQPNFWRNSWILGAAESVKQKIEEQRIKFESTQAGQSIVVVRSAEVDSFVVEKYPHLGKYQSHTRDIREDAYLRGQSDGSQISLDDALPGQTQNQLK